MTDLPVPDGPAKDAPQHVPAPLVAGQGTVGQPPDRDTATRVGMAGARVLASCHLSGLEGGDPAAAESALLEGREGQRRL